ncbi:hypothetical protein DRO61_07115 [Candidatus Bathyarchaeota archaeon]|jgi:hypothetical protein|nr:MAG: hypothetical protein DRO61_07115 [Candidatus Bathyarchaeota archaeon]
MNAKIIPTNNKMSETVPSPRSLKTKLKMSIKLDRMIMPTIPTIDCPDIMIPRASKFNKKITLQVS